MGKFILGYWAIRGRGQALRHLLAYSELQWEDKLYTGPEKWFGGGDKGLLGLDFPNLPYLINDDFKLTESAAIAKYIARKSIKKGLLGKSQQDEAQIQMIMSLLDDIFNPTFSMFFAPAGQKERTRLFQGKMKDKLDKLEAFIGQKDYTLGYITVIDFKLAEAVYYFEKLYDENFKPYKNILRIRSNVESLSEVKKYYQGENAVKEPFLPSYAQFKF